MSDVKRKTRENRHFCTFCCKSFVTPFLRDHLKRGCEKRPFKFVCPTCEKFKSYYPFEAIKHASECIPNGNSIVKCCQCFHRVKAQEFFVHYHRDILNYFLRGNSYKFECHKCGLKFPNEEYLLFHLRRHTKPDYDERMALVFSFRRYPCSICLETLFTKNKMTQHMESKHGLKIDKTKKTVVRRIKKREARDNVRLNGRKPIYACYVCDERFYCRTSARMHVRICEGDNGYNTQPPNEDRKKFKEQLPGKRVFEESQERIFCQYCHLDLSNKLNKGMHKQHVEKCKKKSSGVVNNDIKYIFCPKCKKNLSNLKSDHAKRHMRRYCKVTFLH